jgi:hypothetical protein
LTFSRDNVPDAGDHGRLLVAALVETGMMQSLKSQQSLSSEEDGILNSLLSTYSLPEQETVLTFLRVHPFLLSLLVEAPKVLRTVFGEGISMSLDLETYLGVPDSDDRLVVLVNSSFDIVEACECMSTFDDLWWTHHRDLALGKLNFLPEATDV